jgi:hypothetical protein
MTPEEHLEACLVKRLDDMFPFVLQLNYYLWLV